MKKILSVLVLGLIVWACDDNEEATTPSDNFDRAAMLANWADNIIIPGYEAYSTELSALVEAKNSFTASVNADNFETLKSAWLDAYIAWQKVSMFEIGPAESVTLRDFTNIYPADANAIETNIVEGSEVYNLALPSARDEQGFPALDYLLYGSAQSETEILARFSTEENLRVYLSDVIDRMNDLTNEVLSQWKNGYRDTFVERSGSDASSSVNKFANDYLFYYEKILRAGKIGIPAGVFSNEPLPEKVEAFYNKEVSKTLHLIALNATINFFNGVHFDGNGSGESLKTYLDFLNTITEGEPLSELINTQFDQAIAASEQLNNNFYQQVIDDNTKMLQAFDQIQANVVLLKVDMFQALNVKVDFVDADGD